MCSTSVNFSVTVTRHQFCASNCNYNNSVTLVVPDNPLGLILQWHQMVRAYIYKSGQCHPGLT